jgi:hypothetical protein
MFAGIAGAVLMSTFASGNAMAQSAIYTQDTDCSIVPDADRVACEEQKYSQQLKSGESAEATGPHDQTEIPSSNISGTHLDESDTSTTVPNAEGYTPPAYLGATVTVTPDEPANLPGPEGTTR